LWGNEKEEHFDDKGDKTGETRFEKDWLGNSVQRHYDDKNEKTGETRKGSDWLGRDRAEHFNNKKEKTGQSRNEADWVGRPVQTHYDNSGSEVGTTRRTDDWLGRSRKEHEGQYFKSGHEPQAHAPSGSYGSAYEGDSAKSSSASSTGNRSHKGWVALLIVAMVVIVTSMMRVAQVQQILQPSAATLDSVKIAIPGLLNHLYASLNQGNPRAARDMLSSPLASNTNKLDYICRPFAYRAHYVEGIIERPGQGFQARIHVLFQPVEERAYVLNFIFSGSRVILSDVSDPGDDWIGPAKQRALDLGSKFAYAAKAGQTDVLKEITTPTLDLSKLADPEYQARLQEMGEITQAQVDVESQHGLKFGVLFYSKRGIICQDSWNFLVDNIRGEDKIVKWEFTPIVGCYALFKSYSATQDPNLESYTLERFGLKTAAPS